MSHQDTSSSRSLLHRSRRLVWAAAAVLAIALSLVTVRVTGPRVSVRWQTTIRTADRLALEQSHDLRDGRQDDDQDDLVWRYELGDWSGEAVAALVNDPAVVETNYIDRSTYEVDDPTVVVATRVPAMLRLLPFPLSTDNRFDSLWLLLHVQSLCLIVAGCVLLRGARIRNERRRQTLAIAALLTVGMAAYALPFRPSALRMADSNSYTKNRSNFETPLKALNFENHLTWALLANLYPAFGPGEDAPERTFRALTRAATAWFVVCALAIGILERWSPHVVRYLALAVLAPSTLMYFGHRDFAYLSLNVAVFPLLAHGISQGSKRLEAGSALSGLGAALHAFGLLSLAGAWIGCFVARAPIVTRLERVLRIAAWGTAAWVGWLAIYMIVLKLQITAGHADSGSWRPLFIDERGSGNRVDVALFSLAGVRDLLMSGWVVGAPLLLVAASLWKQHRDQVLIMLCYAIPSVLFWIFYWPPQGLGVDTGHVVGAFPAVYAGAWLCARERRHTTIAAALLISGHLGFWRMVLDTRFVNWSLSL